MVHESLSRKTESAPSPKSGAMGLRVGAPSDVFEQEADRISEEVMAGGKMYWSLATPGPQVQRKCSCGASGGAEGECEECKKENTVQRKANGGANPGYAPPIVDEVLRSGGQPLDAKTRAFFEPRFGHDFSRVRIHTDARAAESARAVSANAYTSGQNIAFDAGHYAPGTTQGNRLLAHELTHVLQQQGAHARGQLQRDEKKKDAPAQTPCLTSADCSKPIPGSSWDFAHQVAKEREESKKNVEDIQKEEKEKQKQQAQDQPEKKKTTPPEEKPPEKKPSEKEKPGKKFDVHVEVKEGDFQQVDTEPAGPADSLKKIIGAEDRSLLGGVYEVIVDPSLVTAAGGLTTHCELASPQPKDDPDARCINVPRRLEEGAKQYDTGAKTISGKSRYDWFTDALGTVRHEKSHIEFEKGPSVGQGHTFDVQHVHNFSPAIYQFELGELNSIISEFQVHYDRAQGSKDDKARAVRKFLIDSINNDKEGIRGILKKLRCVATCDEVNDGIKKVLDRRILGKGESEVFFDIVRDPAQKLDWPK